MRTQTTAVAFQNKKHNSLHMICATLAALLLGASAIIQATAAEPADRAYKIAPQPVSTALKAFAAQSDMQLIFTEADVGLAETPGITGTRSPRDALAQILKGTGLEFEFTTNNVIVVRKIGSRAASTSNTTNPSPGTGEGGTTQWGVRVAQNGPEQNNQSAQQSDSSSKSDSDPNSPTRLGDADGAAPSEDDGATSEILVVGRRTLNADIRRSEDDVRPYVVFDAAEIKRSQASNIEEFLRARLPMNTAQASVTQNNASGFQNRNNRSSINLRGLGENQTLILVDGRRLPRVSLGNNNDFVQSDINGIPVSWVDRIEVLPSSAGAIFGGGATGGVINIILKRDYTGVEVQATYGNTFDTDVAQRRLELTGGFSLENARTRIMLSASRSDSNELLAGNRDFAKRGRDLLIANSPVDFYGMFLPPQGYTSNIRNSNGANLVLDNGTSLNSPFTFVPIGYTGPSTDNGAALLANAGMYSTLLPNDVTANRQTLLTAPTVESYGLNVRRKFTNWLEAFVDLSSMTNTALSQSAGVTSFASLPANAPNNPFNSSILVSFPTPNLTAESTGTSEVLHASAGAIVRLPGQWSAVLEHNWGRSRFETIGASNVLNSAATTALSDGTLNVVSDVNAFPLNYGPYLVPIPNAFIGPFDVELMDTSLRFSGPTIALPAGPVTLSVLAEYRTEDLPVSFSESGGTITYIPERSQSVTSAYLEARVPIVASSMAMPLVESLEVEISARRDEYETRSTPNRFLSVPSPNGPFPSVTYSTNEVASTDYAIGVRYVPVSVIALRASYGTGFLPPSLSQLGATRTTSPFLFGIVADPRRPGRFVGAEVPLTSVQGGNPDVQPEESEAWSFGAVFSPHFIPGLRISADYTIIEKTNEIRTPQNAFLLQNENAYPDRVIRGPNLPGDPVGVPGPVNLLDTTVLNLAETRIAALDIQANYTRDIEDVGTLSLYAVATHQERLERRSLPGGPLVESVGMFDGPLEWRSNVGANLDVGNWQFGWNAQYYDSYSPASSIFNSAQNAQQIARQGSDEIPSQLYHDAFVLYRLGDTGSVLRDTEVAFGIQNLFNEDPPIVASLGPFGGYSPYGDPRLRRFTLSVRKSFH